LHVRSNWAIWPLCYAVLHNNAFGRKIRCRVTVLLWCQPEISKTRLEKRIGIYNFVVFSELLNWTKRYQITHLKLFHKTNLVSFVKQLQFLYHHSWEWRRTKIPLSVSILRGGGASCNTNLSGVASGRWLSQVFSPCTFGVCARVHRALLSYLTFLRLHISHLSFSLALSVSLFPVPLSQGWWSKF